MTRREDAWVMVGASGYNGADSPDKIRRFKQRLYDLIDEYESSNMTAEEFQKKRKALYD